MNGRTVATLFLAPLCAAAAYLLFAFATYPPVTGEYAIQPGLIFTVGLSLAAMFEILVLGPLWYLLRATTAAARVILWLIGCVAWFVGTVGLGYLLGHGVATAVSFAMPFLVPGLVVSTLFAAFIQARPSA